MFLKSIDCFLTLLLAFVSLSWLFVLFFSFTFAFLQVAHCVYEVKKAPASFNNMIMIIALIYATLNEKQYYKVAFSNFSKAKYYQINTK